MRMVSNWLEMGSKGLKEGLKEAYRGAQRGLKMGILCLK